MTKISCFTLFTLWVFECYPVKDLGVSAIVSLILCLFSGSFQEVPVKIKDNNLRQRPKHKTLIMISLPSVSD